MAGNNEIDRLERRLRREGAGPLTEISNQATGSLFSLLGALLQWINRSAEDRPLISILLAFEAGFAIARLGGWHAKH
jgi:hypothetical protein